MSGTRRLLTGAQVITCRGPAPLRGAALDAPEVVEDGGVLIEGETIVTVGASAGLEAAHHEAIERGEVTIERFPGQVLAPGFVDPHTHAVFAGNRALEFERRLRGETYLQILESGGGILETVEKLRRAGREELVAQTLGRLGNMLAHGTTTAEMKTGYGLSLEAEVKTIEVLRTLMGLTPIQLVGTFLGAHAYPRGKDRAAYLDEVIEVMLPAVRQYDFVRFCDVFCDRGVFDVPSTRRILEKARELGFELKLHSDEIEALGATEMACQMGARSVDHLVEATPAGIEALASANTAAILLPGTSLSLGKKYAPARPLIAAGAAVALASDLNPGSCHNESMQFSLSLACAGLRLTPAEAFHAATINAAYAIGMDHLVGSLEAGKQADVVAFDVPDYREVPYKFGVNHVTAVYKKGTRVHQRPAA